eukprot:6491851-Amphidinium_carterae.2
MVSGLRRGCLGKVWPLELIALSVVILVLTSGTGLSFAPHSRVSEPFTYLVGCSIGFSRRKIRDFGKDLACLRFKLDNVAYLHTTGAEDTASLSWSHPERIPVGPIYTDGAVQHPQIRLARAAGWACLQLNAEGQLARVQYGAVPTTACPVQSSAEAEIWALRQADRTPWPANELYSDSKYAVELAAAGPDIASHPRQAYAHVWADYWEGRPLRVKKIKAHMDFELAAALGFTAHQCAGNACADHWAKLGIKCHRASALVGRHANLEQCLRHVCSWVCWQIKFMIVEGVTDHEPLRLTCTAEQQRQVPR